MDLTNPGLEYQDPGVTINPTTGMPMVAAPRLKYFKNDALRGHELAQVAASQAQPSTATLSGPMPDPTPMVQAVPGGPLAPDTSQAPQVSNTVGMTEPPTPVMPKMFKPTFAQTNAPDAAGQPQPVNAGQTKLGKLLSVLGAAAQGAMAGYGQMNPAAGAQAARDIPFQQAERRQAMTQGGLQTQLMQAQVGMLPWERMQKIAALQKTQADIGKTTAEAGKATAEAGAIPTKTALEQAQTEASFFKDDPNLGLIDLRTKQPVGGNAAMAPLTAEEAGILGKQPGERVPLKLANTANEMVNRGIRPVQAGGRSLLVDNKGNTIKDMGASTPVVTMNMMNPFAGTQTPTNTGEDVLNGFNAQQKAIIRGVSNYTIDPDKLPLFRSPQAKFQLLAAVKAYNPSWDETRMPAKAAFMKSAIGGKIGDEINAYQTALTHADLLQTAATALGNGDQRTLTGLRNKFKTEFGSPDVTNFQAIANAYTREVTKALSGGHITDSEISTQGATLPANASPEQIMGTVQKYRQLMASKMQVRQNQMDAAMQGQPNFGTQSPAPTTHIFNADTWKAANPKGDVNAAKAAAKAQGYTIQ